MLLGDVNCSGEVDSIDAFFIVRYTANIYPILPCPWNGDVDDNGVIDTVDALLVLQFEAELITALNAIPAG
jgi:hypothetical protein